MPIDASSVTWDDEPRTGANNVQWDRPPIAVIPKASTQGTVNPEHNPTGSFAENFASGLGQFVTKLATGGKQILDDGAVKLHEYLADTPMGKAIDEWDQQLGHKTPVQIQAEGRAAEAERRRLDAPLDATWGGKLGNAAGAMGLGAFVPGSTFTAAAGTGATVGALEPVAEDGERLSNARAGALGGAAGLGLTKAVARVVRPNTDPAVLKLIDEGVTPTPGHTLGGWAARTEDALTSVPILGDAIRAGQKRAVAELNDAAINRTLAPIGSKLPAGLKGREAIQFADDTLSSAYNQLLPKLTVKADQQFFQDLQTLRGLVKTGTIAPAEANNFERIVQNGVLGKLRGLNALTGQTLKQIESDLGRVASMYQRDPSADKRMLGDAVQELQAMVRDWVQRSNPQYADELSKINAGWANLVRVKKAAGSIGAEDGVFTPGQLQSAVKAADRSKDKSAFSKGKALMQDLSDPARQVLGTKVPDSGTPSRLITAAAGAGGGLGAVLAPKALIATAAPMVAYTPLGQKIASMVLSQRPAAAQTLAEEVRLLAPYMTTLGASVGPKVNK